MITDKIKLGIVISLLVLLVIGCPSSDSYIFEVHFANDYTVDGDNLPLTGLFLKERDGSWTNSLIPTGETLDPGEYLVFAVDITKGDYLGIKVTVEHNSTIYELTESAGADLSISSSPVSTRAYSIVVTVVSDEPVISSEGGFASDPLWGDTEWESPSDETDIRQYSKVSWSPI